MTGLAAPRLADGVVVLGVHVPADAVAQLAGEDEETARAFGWWPARSDLASVAAAIEGWREAWRRGGSTRAFAVRRAYDGVLVAGCELQLGDGGTASISYWTATAHRRRGYAVRAVRLVCEWAFEALAIGRIELRHAVWNSASRAVATACGFVEAGVMRDAETTVAGDRRDLVLHVLLRGGVPGKLSSPLAVEDRG